MTSTTQNSQSASGIADALKSWVMVFLTLGFVVLYGLALIGRIKPPADVSMISRIEPIIFLIIGYYFGRVPAQQNEKILTYQVGRQTQRADAALHAKEQALQLSESLDERVKNAGAALESLIAKRIDETPASSIGEKEAIIDPAVSRTVGIALKILKS